MQRRLEHQPESARNQSTILIVLCPTSDCEGLATAWVPELQRWNRKKGTKENRKDIKSHPVTVNVECIQSCQFDRRQRLFRWRHSAHPRHKGTSGRFPLSTCACPALYCLLSCYPGHGSWMTGRATASSTSCCLTCMPKTSNSGRLRDFLRHPSAVTLQICTDLYRSVQYILTTKLLAPSNWKVWVLFWLFTSYSDLSMQLVRPCKRGHFLSAAGINRAAKRRSFWQVEGQNSLFGICLRALGCSSLDKKFGMFGMFGSGSQSEVSREVLETFCCLSRAHSDVHLQSNICWHSTVLKCTSTKHSGSFQVSIPFSSQSLRLHQQDPTLMFVAAIEELSVLHMLGILKSKGKHMHAIHWSSEGPTKCKRLQTYEERTWGGRLASRPDIGPQCCGLCYIATSLMGKLMRKLTCTNVYKWHIDIVEWALRDCSKKRQKHCLKDGGGGQWTETMKQTIGWRVTCVLARAFFMARRNLQSFRTEEPELPAYGMSMYVLSVVQARYSGCSACRPEA